MAVKPGLGNEDKNRRESFDYFPVMLRKNEEVLMKTSIPAIMAIFLSLFMIGCGSDDDDTPTTTTVTVTTSTIATTTTSTIATTTTSTPASTTTTTLAQFSLGILHMNDHHSHLNPSSATLTFNGQSTAVEMGGFPRAVAKFWELTATHEHVLRLHGGDATTGDLNYTLFGSGGDAGLMNYVAFDAFVPGSHEFDYGETALRDFLDYLRVTAVVIFPTDVLAANVIPQVGVSPLAPQTANDYFKPYTIREFGGEKVGIIGIVNADLTKNSSSPDPTTQFLDETETAQKYIDELTAQGVNKIILMSSYGYENDLNMAEKLSGVDIIISGGSNTLLGENLAEFGLNPEGPYPTLTADKDGNPVYIASAWQYALAVGELNVTFKADGKIESCTGTPHILLGDSFKQNSVELAGAARDEVLNIIDASPELSIVEPDTDAVIWMRYVNSIGENLKKTVLGQAEENLCLERIPGQGYSKFCDPAATRAHGSDVAQIVALAFRNQSKRAEIGIQNAGGVRVDIPAGNITIATAYELLPFANTLVNMEVTGAELVAVLEDALDYAIAPDGSSGAYPYASGMRWTVDISKPKGQRFSDVQVKLKTDSEWSPVDLNRTYIVVTSNYLASGKDGYTAFASISANPDKVEDTSLEYAQSFVDYVKSVGTVSKLPVSEYSTQNFYDADGKLQN